MGGSFSTSNAVWVQTQKPTYFDGEVVYGTIYLNVVKQFFSKGLHLDVIGEEYTRWTTSEARDGQTYTTEHEGRIEFFKKRIQVYNFKGVVSEGQYNFPFQFKLPEGIPGCYGNPPGTPKEEREKGAGLSYIQYKLTSQCDVKGMMNSNVRHTQQMIVQQRLVEPITELRLECTEDVKMCCCIDRGQAHLSAHLDKSAYMPGETVGIISEITNTSKQDFGSVRVELKRAVTLRATDSRGQPSETEFKTYAAKVMRTSYAGVAAGEVKVGADAMSLPMELPTNLSGSTQGRLIHGEYYVDVIFVASALVRNLHCKIPVTIYSPPHVSFIQVMPEWWNGQQMGPAPSTMSMPSVPSMPFAGAIKTMSAVAGNAPSLMSAKGGVGAMSKKMFGGGKNKKGDKSALIVDDEVDYESQQPGFQ